MRITQILREQLETDITDQVTVGIPLLLRLLEYAKEDAKTDMDLHWVVERATELAKQHSVLDMQHYEDIVNKS
jgi:hypothetical protein